MSWIELKQSLYCSYYKRHLDFHVLLYVLLKVFETLMWKFNPMVNVIRLRLNKAFMSPQHRYEKVVKRNKWIYSVQNKGCYCKWQHLLLCFTSSRLHTDKKRKPFNAFLLFSLNIVTCTQSYLLLLFCTTANSVK